MKRLIIAGLLIAATALSAQQKPEIRTPQSGFRAGEAGESACKDSDTCTFVDVEGWVPQDRVAVWVVGPERRAPAVWVQNATGDEDGDVGASVRIGTVHEGAEEWFKIWLLACPADDVPDAGETALSKLPTSCDKSKPVRVYRVR